MAPSFPFEGPHLYASNSTRMIEDPAKFCILKIWLCKNLQEKWLLFLKGLILSFFLIIFK